jgi:4-amino-4-deoxy-L-arabinose transferase-like glycosyltransferase
MKRLPPWSPTIPIILSFLVVATAYSVVVPVLEAPDEPSHVAFVRYVSEQWTLPDQRPQFGYPVGQEGSQPPLYYALGALLWRLSPAPNLAPTYASHNPFVTFVRSSDPPGNRAFYAHTAIEAFPYRGDVLGIHLVRLLGVVLGALTVAGTYATARMVWPRRWALALLAAGVVAFDPQFAFISGVVNNDNAIAAASTLVLAGLARWWRTGGSRPLAVGLGLGIGAAFLSKTEGILLAGPVVLVLAADWVRRRGKTSQADLGLIAVLPVLLAGWWFVRNQSLYGDPIGWSAMLRANGGMLRAAPVDPLAAALVLWQARGTFWGAFGWTNVLFGDRVYFGLDAALALAGLGLIVSLRRLRLGQSWDHLVLPVTILSVWPALVAASLVRWVQVNEAADQWRLLFPAIAPLAILIALGIAEVGSLGGAPLRLSLWERPARRPGEGGPAPTSSILVPMTIATTIALAGIVANALVLTRVIAPRYYPVVATASSVDSSSTPIRFGPDVELVSYQVTPPRVTPGNTIDVDLLWRARQTPRRNWAVSLTLTGESGNAIGQAQSWPQAGSAPTTAWQPGQLYRDHYQLAPVWQSDQPDLAPLWLSLYDASTVQPSNLLVTDASGHPAGNGIVVGRVKLAPSEAPGVGPSHPVDAQLGNSVSLLGYDVADEAANLRITLYWQDQAPLRASYTVFVHLTNPSGQLVAQHDGLPRGGRFPTDAWEPGDRLRDDHSVPVGTLPPGRYEVQVGMYDTQTGQRLPVTAPSASSGDTVALLEWAKP